MFKRCVFILALWELYSGGYFSRLARLRVQLGLRRQMFQTDQSRFLTGAPVNIDNLGSTVNSAVMDQHPAISWKGRSLYFISNRTPGVGGLDIWVCQRANDNDPWGPPQNLGPVVNSSST